MSYHIQSTAGSDVKQRVLIEANSISVTQLVGRVTANGFFENFSYQVTVEIPSDEQSNDWLFIIDKATSKQIKGSSIIVVEITLVVDIINTDYKAGDVITAKLHVFID